MSSSFVSCVPRFKEEKGKGIGGRTLGPYSYDARHPANPPLGVIDPARKSQVFVSMSLQRPKPSVDNTPDLVGPGAYNPQYNLIFPDLVRLEQFAGKRSAMFASTLTRFQKPPGKLQTPDVRYTLEQDAAEWNCNRDGGGCWGRAERESGTIALMEKKMREAATLTSAIGVDEEAEASAAKVVVPSKQMDMCFRELTDVRDMLKETPQALYDGRVPRRVAPAPGAAECAAPAAAEEAEEEKRASRQRSRGGARAEAPVAAPAEELTPLGYRFEVSVVRLNNNQLASVAALPRVLSLMMADVSKLTLLDLSFNQLTRIDPAMSSLTSLCGVRLHMNQLGHIEDLAHLQPLLHLKRLTLMSNPLEAHTKDYRLLVCACLPSLKSLDNVLITKSELVHVAEYAASPKGMRAMALAPRRSQPRLRSA